MEMEYEFKTAIDGVATVIKVRERDHETIPNVKHVALIVSERIPGVSSDSQIVYIIYYILDDNEYLPNTAKFANDAKNIVDAWIKFKMNIS